MKEIEGHGSVRKSIKSCGERMTVGTLKSESKFFYFSERDVQLLPEHVGRLAILELWYLIALIDKRQG